MPSCMDCKHNPCICDEGNSFIRKYSIDRDDIYMICNSYESGYGHGLANDGFDLSKTPHTDKSLGIAYQIGYDAGQQRFKESKE